MGEFEIFSKEDMDIGSLRKIGLLENNGRVHDYMYFLREKKKRKKKKMGLYYGRMDSRTEGILLEIGSLIELCGLPYKKKKKKKNHHRERRR